MEKKSIDFKIMLEAYELIESVLANKFLESQRDQKIFRGAERESTVIALQVKAAITAMTKSGKIEGDMGSLFNLLRKNRIVNVVSFANILDFLTIFVYVEEYDYHADNIIKTALYGHLLSYRAYSKNFAKLMVAIIDANINETYAGRNILKGWMLGNFGDRFDILAEMAARLKFLEESGAANTKVWETRDVIETYRQFQNTTYGLFNDEEVKSIILKPWVDKSIAGG